MECFHYRIGPLQEFFQALTRSFPGILNRVHNKNWCQCIVNKYSSGFSSEELASKVASEYDKAGGDFCWQPANLTTLILYKYPMKGFSLYFKNRKKIFQKKKKKNPNLPEQVWEPYNML